MYLATGTTDPIVRMQNTERFAQKLKDSGVWVTTRYYEGFGHMEPVIAMGSVWRWRAPVLDDMVAFFQMLGAFPAACPMWRWRPSRRSNCPMRLRRWSRSSSR